MQDLTVLTVADALQFKDQLCKSKVGLDDLIKTLILDFLACEDLHVFNCARRSAHCVKSPEKVLV